VDIDVSYRERLATPNDLNLSEWLCVSRFIGDGSPKMNESPGDVESKMAVKKDAGLIVGMTMGSTK